LKSLAGIIFGLTQALSEIKEQKVSIHYLFCESLEAILGI
jgi:type III secretory pathway component EscS